MGETARRRGRGLRTKKRRKIDGWMLGEVERGRDDMERWGKKKGVELKKVINRP